MGDTRPANPHGCWLAAMRFFQKWGKLFQLLEKTALVSVSSVIHGQSTPQSTTPSKPLPRMAYRVPIFTVSGRNRSSLHVQHCQAPKYSGQPAQQPGLSGRNFGQAAPVVRAEGDNRPSEKPLLTLTLTAEQLNHLAFAVYCQISSLEDSHEVDEPEVIEAMNRLNEVSAMCIELVKGAQS